MKKFLLMLCTAMVLVSSCNQNTSNLSPKNTYSPQQKKLTALTDRYKELEYSSINDLAKKEAKRKYLDSIKTLLTDSFDYVLPNFKVTVYDIDVVDIGSIRAFIAKFHDNDGTDVKSVTANEYWMEFDYPLDSAAALEKNPSYQLLKGISENSDTTLSFFYLGDVETDALGLDQFRIRVVPFPKDFNFDSSRKTNLNKK